LATDGSSSPYISCEPAVSVSTTARLGSNHSENLISTQDEAAQGSSVKGNYCIYIGNSIGW